MTLKSVSPSVYSLSTPTPSTLPLHLLAAATVIRRHRSSASASERRRELGKQQQRRRRATEIIIHEETRAEGSREAAEPSEQRRRVAMREPSMVVREAIVERQSDWGYSRRGRAIGATRSPSWCWTSCGTWRLSRWLGLLWSRNRVKNNRTPRSHSSRKMLWVRGGIHMSRS
ncbi:hypothetical protein F2Q69_00054699 [Brassica cretica]|uniref:Uncharacterized protein n=1 Tax=Brassica cretica TaxID=69181 RepID=A0A8S9N440_BRACR|nr:hypothetical protein F2Q69_00054699 [Brassica cretica]